MTNKIKDLKKPVHGKISIKITGINRKMRLIFLMHYVINRLRVDKHFTDFDFKILEVVMHESNKMICESKLFRKTVKEILNS